MKEQNKIDNNEKTVTLTVDIPYSLKDRLKFESYRQSMPIKDIVKESLQLYFKRINDS